MTGIALPAAVRAGGFHLLLAGLFVSASGSLMFKAGEVLSREGWAAARPFALAGGVAIQLGLFTERRGVRVRRSIGRTGRHAFSYQLGASALILTAGVAIASVGRLWSLSGWWPACAALIPCALLLVPAAHLNRQAAATRLATSLQRHERIRP